jgi:hypothetical protein
MAVVVAEGDFVIAHRCPAAWTAADIVRIEDGKLAEYWDALSDEMTKTQSVNGLPMSGDRFSRLIQSGPWAATSDPPSSDRFPATLRSSSRIPATGTAAGALASGAETLARWRLFRFAVLAPDDRVRREKEPHHEDHRRR